VVDVGKDKELNVPEEDPMAKTLQIIPKPDHGQVKRDVSDTLPFFLIIIIMSTTLHSCRFTLPS